MKTPAVRYHPGSLQISCLSANFYRVFQKDYFAGPHLLTAFQIAMKVKMLTHFLSLVWHYNPGKLQRTSDFFYGFKGIEIEKGNEMN